MKVIELAGIDGFTAETLPDGGREVDGVYIGDLLSWVMGRAQADNAWITIMTNINIVAVAALADVSCIVLAEDVKPDEQTLKTAQEKGVNIIRSRFPAYETAVMLSKLTA